MKIDIFQRNSTKIKQINKKYEFYLSNVAMPGRSIVSLARLKSINDNNFIDKNGNILFIFCKKKRKKKNPKRSQLKRRSNYITVKNIILLYLIFIIILVICFLPKI